MSSARTLIRTGISLATRLVKSPAGTGSFFQQIASPTPLEIAPKLFPSLNNLYLPQNDSQSLKKLSCEPLLYPCGLPSLPFFLPDGNPLHLHLDVSLKLNCLLRRFLLPIRFYCLIILSSFRNVYLCFLICYQHYFGRRLCSYLLNGIAESGILCS